MKYVCGIDNNLKEGYSGKDVCKTVNIVDGIIKLEREWNNVCINLEDISSNT